MAVNSSPGAFAIYGGIALTTAIVFYILSYGLKLPKLSGLDRSKAKLFVTNGHELMKQGLAKANVCYLDSDNGVRTVLSPAFANEIRSNPALSFSGAVSEEFHAHIKGFEPFAQFAHTADIFRDAVRIKLNQALGSITKPLSDEMSLILKEQWTDNAEWHDFVALPSIGRIVAQLSSRVFLGEKICRNPDWLRVTTEYSLNCMFAADQLRLWPRLIRPIVAPFLSSWKDSPRYNDAMEWMEQIANGRTYDAAVIQMTFSGTAIISSADLLAQALFDLCGKDDVIQAMREEIITVIGAEGWKKTALYKLELMDSFLKESQRMKPINLVAMKRRAEETIHLSDGTRIPKGDVLMVSCDWMRNPDFYSDPDTFDAYRFIKLRQAAAAGDNSALFVSPSPQHLAFGLGKHACPGRFFTNNEMKISLCHILLKYDFQIPKGTNPQPRGWGFSLSADPEAKLVIRRRKEEIVLEDVTDE
ncbi:hypothetical protein N7492_005974 [Penicillium capsulatum]|uniref:Cytochrome P450 n=1 Tax=Penicillium capsulatum TaxID=69766 RepID=A0A9W9LS64_9EURO|nr:hypothetical protein N7492_005974 [Penicillium capsulatum]KAJ6134922.1 hypothetical protein N7512_000082 [Penicillium capsulatum]